VNGVDQQLVGLPSCAEDAVGHDQDFLCAKDGDIYVHVANGVTSIV
jgi:hypothetical protein